MNRKISTRRVFFISQFNTFEVVDEITDIPESLVFDGDFIAKIYNLQNISIEERYRKYMELTGGLKKLDDDTALNTLSSLRKELTNNLLDILEDKKEK
jgi:hypothetical protein